MHFWAELDVSLIEIIFKGLLIGIVASAPMGPVGILCLQRTMQKGRTYGLVTGAGAALSDLLYALMTGFGMSFVMDFITNERNMFWLQLAGSVMLFLFGLYMFMSDPQKGFRPVSKNKGTLVHNFVTSFLVTFSNPLIIFLFIALFARFVFIIPEHPLSQALGYFSIVAGAMLWWIGLTYVVDKMRNNFGLRGVKRMNVIIGSVVLAAAVVGAGLTLLHLSFPFHW